MIITNDMIEEEYGRVIKKLGKFIKNIPKLSIDMEHDTCYGFYCPIDNDLVVIKPSMTSMSDITSTIIHELVHHVHYEYSRASFEAEYEYHDCIRNGGHDESFSIIYHRALVIYNDHNVTLNSDLGATEYKNSTYWSDVKERVYKRQLRTFNNWKGE